MQPQVQKVAHSQQSSFVYRVKADAAFSRGWHCHPEYELTYIQRSRGRRFVGDSIAEYQSGDLVLLGPDLPHTWRSASLPAAGDSRGRGARLHRAIVIQFREDFLGEGFWQRPELRPIGEILKRAARGLQVQGDTRDLVARRMIGMKRLGGQERLLELLLVLGLISGGGSDVRPISSRRYSPAPNPRLRRRFDRVFSYLDGNYTAKLSQAKAAGLIGMSAGGFSRFFRRAAGKTFVEYVGELRVAHACRLLADTDLSVLDVSLRSGFNNLSNFNRRFLHLKGMTPREYRARFAEASPLTAP